MIVRATVTAWSRVWSGSWRYSDFGRSFHFKSSGYSREIQSSSSWSHTFYDREKSRAWSAGIVWSL